MLTKVINIKKLISKNDYSKIYEYSKLISQAYNICLDSLRNNNDFKSLGKIVKQFTKEHECLYSKHVQNASRECINAIKTFYAIRKTDKNARFPKRHRFISSIKMDSNIQKGKNGPRFGGGFKLIGSKIIFKYPKFELDLSNCKYFNPDEININTLKQIILKFERDKLNCYFVYEEQKQEIKQNNGFISIDLGISSIASIYSSKGECLKYKTRRFKGLEKEKDELKSKLSKKKKYSKRYNRIKEVLNRKQKKITNKRKDFLHKTSKNIIDYCKNNQIDNIIIGDIKTKKLKKNYKCGLNKSTQNEGLLSRFKSFIEYKSKLNGIRSILVNEAYTSQRNCLTGELEIDSNLSVRCVELERDFVVDRDLNSAVNIAKKYGVLWFTHSFNKYSLLNVNEIYI